MIDEYNKYSKEYYQISFNCKSYLKIIGEFLLKSIIKYQYEDQFAIIRLNYTTQTFETQNLNYILLNFKNFEK